MRIISDRGVGIVLQSDAIQVHRLLLLSSIRCRHLQSNSHALVVRQQVPRNIGPSNEVITAAAPVPGPSVRMNVPPLISNVQIRRLRSHGPIILYDLL